MVMKSETLNPDEFEEELASLRRERDDLIEERDNLKDLVEGNMREVLLEEMHFQNGVMETYLKHPIFGIFAASITEMFIDMGAVNYIEPRLWCEKIGFVAVTCQREAGQTPHALRAAAEAERDSLRAYVEKIESDGLPRIAALEATVERMREALDSIVSWANAYPTDVFPEPDLIKARALLEAGGITLDSVSAGCMRHVVEEAAKIARAGLAEKEEGQP